MPQLLPLSFHLYKACAKGSCTSVLCSGYILACLTFVHSVDATVAFFPLEMSEVQSGMGK